MPDREDHNLRCWFAGFVINQVSVSADQAAAPARHFGGGRYQGI